MISVIIPVLNEAASLGQCLAPLQTWGDRLEIIVVDGGSTDETLALAQTFPVKTLQTETGRAIQMNAGAAIAKGDILLFLHGDTILPDTFIADIEQTLTKPNTVAGAFPLKIDDPHPGLRWIERLVQWRSQWLSLPYGDQALFLRKTTFQALGGYCPLPIMEDYELVQRLKKQGKIALAQHPVTTSARRWQTLGIWRTTVINQIMILGYHLKLDPHTLRDWYRHQRTKGQPTNS